MKAAEDLVDIIKDLVQQELDKKDTVVLCEVAAPPSGDAYYDVYVVPDRTTVVHAIPNMTKFDFAVGEYCYVYKIKNSFVNAFICCKVSPDLINPNTTLEIATEDILKAIQDSLDKKQDLLIDGQNIKTINNISILGSGNIEISPGGTLTDITLNGTSVIFDTVGVLTTNNGVVSNENNIGLSLAGCEEIAPKTLTLAQQDDIHIFLSDNGITKSVSLNNLDYTKLRVVDSEDLAVVNVNDFLFIKES